MTKKYYMDGYQMREAFEKFKNNDDIKEALREDYHIYLRENGYMIIKPDSLFPTQDCIRGKFKIRKPLVSKRKLDKIEQNYCLYSKN
jgi:hypothetical protein